LSLKKEAKMHVRISTIEGDTGKIDDAVTTINEKVLPVLKGIEGFTAANFLADRSSGKLIGLTFWDSESALDASAEVVNPIRTAVADAMGGKATSVESYELVAQSW
jgi:heme-degrading monooxygenase HmoA